MKLVVLDGVELIFVGLFPLPSISRVRAAFIRLWCKVKYEKKPTNIPAKLSHNDGGAHDNYSTFISRTPPPPQINKTKNIIRSIDTILIWRLERGILSNVLYSNYMPNPTCKTVPDARTTYYVVWLNFT